MEKKQRKGLLVVSFGTSVPETRKKTIDAIEMELAAAFPKYRLYRAWTSRRIKEKLWRRDGIRISSVEEAFFLMREDGITQVIVQPTHVIDGFENEELKEIFRNWEGSFEKMVLGEPLLADTSDQREVIQTVMEEFPDLDAEDALIFMAHGTEHPVNKVYHELGENWKKMGYPNVLLGTVESSPSLEEMLHQAAALHPRRVLLAPFLVVAGEHVLHDMAGEDASSWKNRFEAAGYPVCCVKKGLGEYPGIRDLYVKHAKAAEQRLSAM